MEVRVLGGALWRQRVLVLLILVVTGVAVGIGLLVAPKTYTSVATVTVGRDSQTDNAGGTGDVDDPLVLGTIAELASSRAVVDEVRDDLQQAWGTDRSAEDLRQSVGATWREGTLMIDITAHDEDPVTAARIANLVADRGVPHHPPAGTDLTFTTSDTAAPAATYSSPDLLLSGGVGLVLACVLAACGALIRDHRTHTVDDASAVEEAAIAPLLAHVPTPRDPTTLPALYPGTAAAEVFRHLRVALESEGSGTSANRVVVAGVTAGDVNVWLGANLAISLAKVGHRALLIDGRLGTSVASRVDEPDAPGLYDVLMGVDLDDALSSGPVDLLTVLPAGGWSGESGRSLLESHFADVIAEAQDRFDVIVVLAPPLDRSDDARLMAAGGLMLLAVPEGGISATALRAHADRVRSVGARLLGTVLVGRRLERAVA